MDYLTLANNFNKSYRYVIPITLPPLFIKNIELNRLLSTDTYNDTLYQFVGLLLLNTNYMDMEIIDHVIFDIISVLSDMLNVEESKLADIIYDDVYEYIMHILDIITVMKKQYNIIMVAETDEDSNLLNIYEEIIDIPYLHVLVDYNEKFIILDVYQRVV